MRREEIQSVGNNFERASAAVFGMKPRRKEGEEEEEEEEEEGEEEGEEGEGEM